MAQELGLTLLEWGEAVTKIGTLHSTDNRVRVFFYDSEMYKGLLYSCSCSSTDLSIVRGNHLHIVFMCARFLQKYSFVFGRTMKPLTVCFVLAYIANILPEKLGWNWALVFGSQETDPLAGLHA